MKQFFSFLLGAGGHLSSGSVRFVTRRSAWVMASGAAVVFSVIALAAGVAIGMHVSPTPGSSTSDERSAHHATRDYVVGEIGKLSASVAQFEPRIAHLAKQVGELRHLQTRLSGKKAAPRKPAGEVDPEGEGGPMLPPRYCPEAQIAPTQQQANTRIMQRQIDCIGALLTVLEREAVAHANTWASIPGRTPIDGARFSSAFGNRMDPFNSRLGFHSGVDLVAPTGTPILATAGGRVIFAGEKDGYGHVVEIDHGNGLVTRYAHASRLVVRAGDVVLPRQHIADVGSTGRSTGPHLHMEVLENGAPVNPAGYMALFAEPPHG